MRATSCTRTPHAPLALARAEVAAVTRSRSCAFMLPRLAGAWVPAGTALSKKRLRDVPMSTFPQGLAEANSAVAPSRDRIGREF